MILVNFRRCAIHRQCRRAAKTDISRRKRRIDNPFSSLAFHNEFHPVVLATTTPPSPPLIPPRAQWRISKNADRFSSSGSSGGDCDDSHPTPLQAPAGIVARDGGQSPSSSFFIPQKKLHGVDGRVKKRVLVLCTGGTLTMAPDSRRNDALHPVEGVLTKYMSEMKELEEEGMPEVVTHEYVPLLDSSDLGPTEWAVIASDIHANYLQYDGFVVLMGTDTMAYTATALSFMLENLNKPVVFTGSQIPLTQPHNDARRNLIMALIFASRDTINEVTIFFHDRLLRACRASKVNTSHLHAFDTPNMDPLAKVGVTIEENVNLALPPARGALRLHTAMETRVMSLRLVPGFDDRMIRRMIEASTRSDLRALVLQLYGMGNLPSVKDSIIRTLEEAREKGVLVVASTQCHTGSVMMGHYATGQALIDAGVVSASDMTLEAISCKVGYLFGRGDLTAEEVGGLVQVSLRGEVTPEDAFPPPLWSNAYQRIRRKGKTYY